MGDLGVVVNIAATRQDFRLDLGCEGRRGITIMVQKAILAGLFLQLGSSLSAQSLDLPARQVSAPTGTAFAQSIADLPLAEREQKIIAEVKAGNVPPVLRKLVAVSVSAGNIKGTYFVAPDYIGIGSDDDYFLTPLSPLAAQEIADRLDCVLPTPKMVDDIYASATVKLTPAPIPPSPAMTTVAVFLRHNEMVRAARGARARGELVAGHKKDVVIANKVFATPGKVAIYGWHKRDGKPIQPLYTGHTASWVDYSHGIRLVSRRMIVNGVAKTIDEVLADPKRSALLSNEGVMLQTRYLRPDLAPSLKASPGAKLEELRLEGGVRVVIDRLRGDSAKPLLLVFYALPNGNTIEQTIGKAQQPGDDWHFDIQHIGAQFAFLREKITDRNLVVAYLENDRKSWPAWRKTNGDARVAAIVESVRKRFDEPRTHIVLSGHSGGGSFAFGYVNSVATIPDQVERIAFLDANYAYETDRHKDKLMAWLKASDAHYLVVLAYNDAVALLNGKAFVTASGGTWGRSHRMLEDMEKTMPFTKKVLAGLERAIAMEGRVTFLLKENPDRKVLHTVQVERNGFIESLLAGTTLEGVGYTYFGERAYRRFISAD
jgi:hypothetical protein